MSLRDPQVSRMEKLFTGQQQTGHATKLGLKDECFKKEERNYWGEKKPLYEITFGDSTDIWKMVPWSDMTKNDHFCHWNKALCLA